MTKIMTQLKDVYIEMKDIAESPGSSSQWAKNRKQALSTLEDIQYEIDALPKVEEEINKKHPEESQKFNDKMSAVRDLYNKIQDIEDLLYYANLSDDYSYYEKVAKDPALEARIDNIIQRIDDEGLLIPLNEEYTQLTLPETSEEAEVNVDYSDI